MKKINLLKPDIAKQYLSRNLQDEVTYLKVDPDLTREELVEDIANGATFLKEVLELADKKPNRVIAIKCKNREEGLVAVSYLASLYNIEDGVEREEMDDYEDEGKSNIEFEDFSCEDGFEDFGWVDNNNEDDEWENIDDWEETPWKLPIIEYDNLQNDNPGSFQNPFYNNGMGFGRVTNNDSKGPYWRYMRKEPICVVYEFGGVHGMYNFSTSVFGRYGKNRHLFLLVVDPYIRVNDDSDDEEPRDKWGELGIGVLSSYDSMVAQFVLEQSADIISTHHDDKDMDEYYRNLFVSWVDHYGYSLENEFPVESITKRIIKMEGSGKSEMIDKVICYVTKDFEKPRTLTDEDFNVLYKLRGLGFKYRKEEKEHKGVNKLEMSLVGLDDIKDDITGIIETFKYNRRRSAAGLKTGGYHNVHMMLGAPGTAKTTVAQILGEIMAEERLLRSNRFISVNGAELKGMYVGHTAPKVKALFDDYDVIFIDEAYAVAAGRDGESDSFSQEAIAQLIIELENHGMDRLVIFAGYGGPNVSERDNKMLDFLKCNPGIRSRINSTLVFRSYDAEEMLAIFKRQAKLSQYRVPKAAEKYVLEFFKKRIKEQDFGNGREARSLLENATVQAAKRVARIPEKKITKQMLQQLTTEDIRTAIVRMEHAQASQYGKYGKKTLGFGV